ncbi:unnamed protein product [Colias eurytheme]|nr:unnamed protein product [Colias eurytheme]
MHEKWVKLDSKGVGLYTQTYLQVKLIQKVCIQRAAVGGAGSAASRRRDNGSAGLAVCAPLYVKCCCIMHAVADDRSSPRAGAEARSPSVSPEPPACLLPASCLPRALS